MNVLVIGGTGPTGPTIVSGLRANGHDVTILHTGMHEVDLGADVEHIHADPHFADSLRAGIGTRTFDLVIAMYGRLGVVADVARGCTDRLIGITGIFYRGWVDDVLHLDDRARAGRSTTYHSSIVPTTESEPFEAHENGGFTAKAVAASEAVIANHHAGHYGALMLRFPRIYGPRQPSPREWSIIKRLLDGRTEILVPDGGMLLQSQVYSENAARFVLAATEKIDEAGGNSFNVADGPPRTTREWISTIAACMGRQVEIVSVPLAAGSITFPYVKGPFTMCHKVLSTERARDRLDIADLVSYEEGIRRTVGWCVDNPESVDDHNLNDAFDYETEDRLIDAARRWEAELTVIGSSDYRYSHAYRHPRSPS